MVHNFYPRSPCGERLIVARKLQTQTHISIHALLAESDSQCRTLASGMYAFLSTLSLRRATRYLSIPSWNTSDFYPRSPCGERLVKATVHICRGVFLSTLSLRRATHGHGFQKQVFAISIHALLAESDAYRSQLGSIVLISIHALLAESDDRQRPARPDCQDFYPRSPCGERRAEQSGNKVNHNFYPRSPCGERPFLSGSIKFCSVFLSTLSLRRATLWVLADCTKF